MNLIFQKSGFELITTTNVCIVRQSWMGEPYGPPKMRVFFILCVIFDGSDNKTEDSKCFWKAACCCSRSSCCGGPRREEPQQQNTQLLSSRQKLWNDGPRNILHLLNIWDSRIPLEPKVHIIWKICTKNPPKQVNFTSNLQALLVSEILYTIGLCRDQVLALFFNSYPTVQEASFLEH